MSTVAKTALQYLDEAAPRPPARRTPITIPNGTLEALKWLGVLLMTLDHVNKYLLHAAVPAMYAAGRLCVPLFGMVLAYNLARPGAHAAGVDLRTAKRLAAFGLLACLPAMALGGLIGGWWPLNILCTLLVATLVIAAAERGGVLGVTAACVIFLVGGGLVEFCWPALGFVVAAWRYFRTRSPWALLATVLITPTLALNAWALGAMPLRSGLWALLALPLIACATKVDLSVKRHRWFFYAYFPAHLGLIWVARSLLT